MRRLAFGAAAAVALGLCVGCKTAMPKTSGFLSDYSHLKESNDSTWRYVNDAGLGACDTFMISSVKVMVTEYAGSQLTPERQQKLADAFRQKIANDLKDRYPIVTAPSPTTGEIRAAITRAYRVGDSLALWVEGEVLNSESHQQLAAVLGAQVGPPEMGFKLSPQNPADPGHFTPAWWDRPGATQIMEEWSAGLRKTVDQAHKR